MSYQEFEVKSILGVGSSRTVLFNYPSEGNNHFLRFISFLRTTLLNIDVTRLMANFLKKRTTI